MGLSFYMHCLSTSCPNYRVKMLTTNKLMLEKHLGHSNPALVRVVGTYMHTAATVSKPRDVVGLGLELPCSTCLDCSIEGTILELDWSENSSSKTKIQMPASSSR